MTGARTDAVIIGAGHNSLACAVHLSAKGWRVHVLEQADTPGGAVKTCELTLAGYRHDWGAMNLSLFAGSRFFEKYGNDLKRLGLEFVPVSHPFASVFPDGKWCGISTDVAATRARIAAFSETDACAWDALGAAFPDRAERIFAVLSSPMGMRAFATLMAKQAWKHGTAETAELAGFLLSSPRDWLDRTFESEHVKAMLGAWGMHLDFAPDIAGGAVFPWLEAMAGQAFGMVLGKGGAETIVTAMRRLIEDRGGTVECGARVTRILHEQGRARGVELADGRQIGAKRAVIANVAPAALVRLIGGSGEIGYDRAMRGFRHAPGTMMIHLAMDDLPAWTAGPELRAFAYVHLAPSLDQMARTYQQARAGLLPEEPVIVCGQPTAVDPTRAPEGRHVLWLQLRMVPGRIRGDAAGRIPATDWDGAAVPFAERALDILERYAPGTRDRILGRRIVTPVELEADKIGVVGGDQICGSHHLSQHFLFRPVAGRADGSTPIRDLHHTGAAVWPGAGTGAGPGYMLGRKLAGD